MPPEDKKIRPVGLIFHHKVARTTPLKPGSLERTFQQDVSREINEGKCKCMSMFWYWPREGSASAGGGKWSFSEHIFVVKVPNPRVFYGGDGESERTCTQESKLQQNSLSTPVLLLEDEIEHQTIAVGHVQRRYCTSIESPTRSSFRLISNQNYSEMPA